MQVSHSLATQDTVVVTVSGELDMATSDVLAGVLADALNEPGIAQLLVDARSITFCDSSGLNALVRAHHAAASRDVCLRVVEPPDRLRMIMEITCLLDLLTAGQVSEQRTPPLHPARSTETR